MRFLQEKIETTNYDTENEIMELKKISSLKLKIKTHKVIKENKDSEEFSGALGLECLDPCLTLSKAQPFKKLPCIIISFYIVF